MAAYFQMGNDTENLIAERELGEFKGIVLSPVNREAASLVGDIAGFRRKGDYDVVLSTGQKSFFDTA